MSTSHLSCRLALCGVLGVVVTVVFGNFALADYTFFVALGAFAAAGVLFECGCLRDLVDEFKRPRPSA